MSEDTFWEEYPLKYNDEDDGFEFVNLVDVAEEFVKMVSVTSRLGYDLERLTEAKANVEVEKQRAERALNTLRRTILSDGLQDVAKTSKPQILEAFILERAKQNNTEGSLLQWENKIEECEKKLEIIQPRINKVQSRLTYMKIKAENLRQYLDYQKLQLRIEEKVWYGA